MQGDVVQRLVRHLVTVVQIQMLELSAALDRYLHSLVIHLHAQTHRQGCQIRTSLNYGRQTIIREPGGKH